MISIFKNNFIHYLFFILPFTYLVGVLITEIFVFLIIIYFLIINKDLSLFKDKKFIFLFMLSIYIGINAFVQIDDNLKISSVFYFRFIIFSLAIFFFLKYFENIRIDIKKNIINVNFIIVSLILFDAFFQFLTGENLFGYKIIYNRISGIFKDELILGSFLIKILPFLTWLIFYSNIDIHRNKKKLIIFFSFYIICIFLSGERTSLGLCVLYFIGIVIFLKQLRKIFLFSFLSLIFFIISITVFPIGKSDPNNRIFTKTFHQFTNHYFIKQETNKIDQENEEVKKKVIKENILIFSKDHTGHFQLAFKLFKENPIFGVGPKGFRHYCRSVNYNPEVGICSTHPHNFLVQISSETGLIGLTLYIYIICFLIFKLVKSLNINTSLENKSSLIIISIGMLVILFPFLPSGNFFNNWISIINYYLLGIYFYSYNKVFNR